MEQYKKLIGITLIIQVALLFVNAYGMEQVSASENVVDECDSCANLTECFSDSSPELVSCGFPMKSQIWNKIAEIGKGPVGLKARVSNSGMVEFADGYGNTCILSKNDELLPGFKYCGSCRIRKNVYIFYCNSLETEFMIRSFQPQYSNLPLNFYEELKIEKSIVTQVLDLLPSVYDNKHRYDLFVLSSGHILIKSINGRTYKVLWNLSPDRSRGELFRVASQLHLENFQQVDGATYSVDAINASNQLEGTIYFHARGSERLRIKEIKKLQPKSVYGFEMPLKVRIKSEL